MTAERYAYWRTVIASGLVKRRAPRYYSAPAPGTDPARGPFAPTQRTKPGKRGRR